MVDMSKPSQPRQVWSFPSARAKAAKAAKAEAGAKIRRRQATWWPNPWMECSLNMYYMMLLATDYYCYYYYEHNHDNKPNSMHLQ